MLQLLSLLAMVAGKNEGTGCPGRQLTMQTETERGQVDRMVELADPETGGQIVVPCTYDLGSHTLFFDDPLGRREEVVPGVWVDDFRVRYVIDTTDGPIDDPLGKRVWELFWESAAPMSGQIMVGDTPVEVREHVRFGWDDAPTGVVLQRPDGRKISIPRELYDQRIAPLYEFETWDQVVARANDSAQKELDRDRIKSWAMTAEVVAEDPDMPLTGLDFADYIDQLLEQEDDDQSERLDQVAAHMRPILDQAMIEQRVADELIPLSNEDQLNAFLAGA